MSLNRNILFFILSRNELFRILNVVLWHTATIKRGWKYIQSHFFFKIERKNSLFYAQTKLFEGLLTLKCRSGYNLASIKITLSPLDFRQSPYEDKRDFGSLISPSIGKRLSSILCSLLKNRKLKTSFSMFGDNPIE